MWWLIKFVLLFFQYEDFEESPSRRQTGEENVVKSDDNIDEEPEEDNFFISFFNYHWLPVFFLYILTIDMFCFFIA